MNDKVEHALQRLGAVLPLQAGLRSLDIAEAGLYCRLLRSYVERGRALTRDEAAGLVADAARSLDRLAASKLVVLDTEGSPVGAYPFTSAAREHRVRIGAVTAHCMCALDALAVSPTFDRSSIPSAVPAARKFTWSNATPASPAARSTPASVSTGTPPRTVPPAPNRCVSK